MTGVQTCALPISVGADVELLWALASETAPGSGETETSTAALKAEDMTCYALGTSAIIQLKDWGTSTRCWSDAGLSASVLCASAKSTPGADTIALTCFGTLRVRDVTCSKSKSDSDEQSNTSSSENW